MIGVCGEVQVEVFVQVLKVTVMHVKSQETGAWLCSIRLECVYVWVHCLSEGGEFVLQWMGWDAGMGRWGAFPCTPPSLWSVYPGLVAFEQSSDQCHTPE